MAMKIIFFYAVSRLSIIYINPHRAKGKGKISRFDLGVSCVRHADIPGASVINQLVHAKWSLGENIGVVSSVFHGNYLPI